MTFYTVRGEEGGEKHGILDSRWSFFRVFSVVLVKTFFYVPGELSQPHVEKLVNPIVKGLITHLARLSLAFSHALNNVTSTTNPVYLVLLESFSTPLNKLRRLKIAKLSPKSSSAGLS